VTVLSADRLYTFLADLPAQAVLPRAAEIAELLGIGTNGAYHVAQAFDTLEAARRIETVHGTRSVARGHRIVRLPNGRTFATEGCPLALQRAPGAPATRPVANT
jgi:hypothetical protein